jgi:hypothetical protein
MPSQNQSPEISCKWGANKTRSQASFIPRPTGDLPPSSAILWARRWRTPNAISFNVNSRRLDKPLSRSVFSSARRCITPMRVRIERKLRRSMQPTRVRRRIAKAVNGQLRTLGVYGDADHMIAVARVFNASPRKQRRVLTIPPGSIRSGSPE